MARPHVLGRGLATEGAVASARYGFDELGLERIISIIQPANVASHRVGGEGWAHPPGRSAGGVAKWSGAR